MPGLRWAYWYWPRAYIGMKRLPATTWPRKNTLPLDVKFLLTLSNKTLPLLELNKDIFDNRQLYTVDSEADLLYRRQMDYKAVFENRKLQFANEQLQYSWLSWNGSDAWVKKQFSKDNTSSSIQQ